MDTTLTYNPSTKRESETQLSQIIQGPADRIWQSKKTNTVIVTAEFSF